MPGSIRVEASVLFGYMQKIMDVASMLEDMRAKASQKAVDLIDAEEYQGKALEEMSLFYNSINIHIQKLILFYGKAIEYIGNVFEEMRYAESEIINMLQGYVASANETNPADPVKPTSPQNVKKCSVCGLEVTPSSTTCPVCGAKVK